MTVLNSNGVYFFYFSFELGEVEEMERLEEESATELGEELKRKHTLWGRNKSANMARTSGMKIKQPMTSW